MSPQAEAVTDRLEATWMRWWTYSLLTGMALAASASLVALFAFILVDALVPLPRAALVLLFGAWVALTVALVVWLVRRTRRSQRSPAATARRIEMEFPELGSSLINVVQFAEDDSPFGRAAADQAAAEVGRFPFEQAAGRETRWRRFVLCLQMPRDFAEACAVLAGVLVLGYVVHLFLPRWWSSTERLLRPWAFVPSVGSVKILRVTPGDTEVLIGSGLAVSAEIDNPGHCTYPATLYVTPDGQPEAALRLLPDESNQKFVASLAQVAGPLHYRVQIGDSQSKSYRVGVREKPAVAEITVTYNYPAYLGRPPETVTQKTGDLEAPQFTVAELTVRASVPLGGGYFQTESRQVVGVVGDGGRALHAYLLLDKPMSYTIHLADDVGYADPEPRVNRIRVRPDAPPTVQIAEPTRESNAPVGKTAVIVVRAGDDYGLSLVRLELKRGGDAKPAGQDVETVASWTKFASGTEVVLRHELALDPKLFKPGETIQVRAVAQDRRALDIDSFGLRLNLDAQETATPWHQLRVMAPEARAAADLAQLKALRAAVYKILQEQTKARVATAEAPRQPTPGDAARLAGEVRARQVEVQKATVAVVEMIGQTDDQERLVIKRAANKLAYGDMVEAVRQAEALQKGQALADFVKPAATLAATQDRIIDVLRRLLNEVRKETADVLAEMDKKRDTSLPSDVQDKLRELKDKLEEFLKQQKKVIEASENLAKTPVDDFTEKEKQLLKDLAAAEDDWSRFMKEKYTDLSKLPEQDFSNPSLLQEMVEVQTQLKMAEDALTKKSADIAVPLEQLGAEMAKEMTTNIEKWLPDTPDRERWSQEEPLTDDMKEAPMAELPKELEDIVGDLMEKEEDLFDEMEDVSSSWVDSLDKGAGWDAADGPISNFSARGVTGNRLPNTSEIGGRSGEGRSGKASGEFVGDSAVGKGGRKTPSRLTPDANVKGQVKDRSKDPTGGATGGGKESGQGGEGLQGPVPNRPERELQRLANKQAELRNQAESVDLRFKVLEYHHTDLRKMIDQMAAVENDLRSGRYQNALRRRDVLLDGLGQVKTYVKGEFTIRQDRSANLPTDIQKEILGSMQEASPAGWEGLNRQYFERLTTGKDAPPATPKKE
jgi:hypothetical protein